MNHNVKTQTGTITFAYTCNIPATINDIPEVTASRNIQGKKTATLTGGEGK